MYKKYISLVSPGWTHVSLDEHPPALLDTRLLCSSFRFLHFDKDAKMDSFIHDLYFYLFKEFLSAKTDCRFTTHWYWTIDTCLHLMREYADQNEYYVAVIGGDPIPDGPRSYVASGTSKPRDCSPEHYERVKAKFEEASQKLMTTAIKRVGG